MTSPLAGLPFSNPAFKHNPPPPREYKAEGPPSLLSLIWSDLPTGTHSLGLEHELDVRGLLGIQEGLKVTQDNPLKEGVSSEPLLPEESHGALPASGKERRLTFLPGKSSSAFLLRFNQERSDGKGCTLEQWLLALHTHLRNLAKPRPVPVDPVRDEPHGLSEPGTPETATVCE